jgi:hypothetical protein
MSVEMNKGCADDDTGAELFEYGENPDIDSLEGELVQQDWCKHTNRAGT